MPAADSPALLRTTQRAPRSCVSCSSRKVKCDKAIPCSTCISRGTADRCVREMVIVRGEVKIAADLPDQPSYDALLKENQRLQAELQARKTSPNLSLRSSFGRRPKTLDSDEMFEEVLFDRCASMSPPTSSGRLNWSSIVLPSPTCSEQLLDYDRMWNSWAHYAVEYSRFNEEHQVFLSSLQQGVPLEQTDIGWLAVYFSVLCAALLMMDDNEARKLPLPDHVSHGELCRHWYDVALFCLHESEFMRRANIRSVQAVAILGMCFNNFGDPDLCNHLWSCAIRTAQKLGIDDPNSQRVLPLSSKGRHRLWWTLVICEWMAVPYHPPQVEEGDFDMTLPSPDAVSSHADDADIQPVYYHIFMSRTSIVYYRFRASLRDGEQPLADVVRRADEELAEVINTLPEYLQPDNGETESINKLEETHPWIKWQRFDITLVLLHHRLRINRVLQQEWLSSPGRYEWAKSLCVNSATTIIWISHNWDQPATMRKQWALSMHLFVAAMLLFRESRSSQETGPLEYHDEIETAISQLEEVASQSAIAFQGAALLRSLLDGRLALQT